MALMEPVVKCATQERYEDHAPAKEYILRMSKTIFFYHLIARAIILLIVLTVLTLCYFFQVRRKEFQGTNEVFHL